MCIRDSFMSQSNRKHSPVISDSQWTLVPPPSRQLGGHCSLMLWLSWATICPSYKFHLLQQQSRVPIPCHSANNETESVQVSDSLVKKSAEFERSAQQAPKRLTSPLSKRGGNNDDNLFYCAGERRKKMKCSFSKIRQAGLVDFDSKISILIHPTYTN